MTRKTTSCLYKFIIACDCQVTADNALLIS